MVCWLDRNTFKQGDTMEMQLDFNLKQLIFMKNDKRLWAHHMHTICEHLQYRMAIAMINQHSEIEILSFECC